MTTDETSNVPRMQRKRLPDSLDPQTSTIFCTRCDAKLYDETGHARTFEEQPCTEGYAQHNWDSAETLTSSFRKALEAQFPDAFKPEIIDGTDVAEAAEDVLLEVAFSPVVPKREDFCPVDAIILENGKYRLCYPPEMGDYVSLKEVTPEELKVMRARYLLTRGLLHRSWATLPPHIRREALKWYFKGQAPWVPKPGSRLADVPAGGLSIALKPGQTHTELLSELLAEAGANPETTSLAFTTAGQMLIAPDDELVSVKVASQDLRRERARLLGILAARADHQIDLSSPQDSSGSAPPTDHPKGSRKKAAGRPSKPAKQPDTLPIAEAWFSIVELPATVAPSPNPALRSRDGLARAVFAVWYSSFRPDIAELEPPDELGCFVGAQCGVEAQTEADRLIRRRKGPRSFAWPLPSSFAERVHRDGILQRTTSLTQQGREAVETLGLDPKNTRITDDDVRAAYRRHVTASKAHPDQGGARAKFEELTRLRDVALAYVIALGETRGVSVKNNEQRATPFNKAAAEYLVTWLGDIEQAPTDQGQTPDRHARAPTSASIEQALLALERKGYAVRAAETGRDVPARFWMSAKGRRKAKKLIEIGMDVEEGSEDGEDASA